MAETSLLLFNHTTSNYVLSSIRSNSQRNKKRVPWQLGKTKFTGLLKSLTPSDTPTALVVTLSSKTILRNLWNVSKGPTLVKNRVRVSIHPQWSRSHRSKDITVFTEVSLRLLSSGTRLSFKNAFTSCWRPEAFHPVKRDVPRDRMLQFSQEIKNC